MVLGVCGGIAAYKAIEVCRRLVDAGAHVSPVLTAAAEHFVGALTFTALASEPARSSLWGGSDPIPHTRLGQQADLIVVVPATARLIGTYAAGISSELLTAVLLATRAPVLLAPAMHAEMWDHDAVRDNVALLERRGVHFIGPRSGHLAGGDVGPGRLADPGDIVAAATAILNSGGAGDPDAAPTGGKSRDLVGVAAVVTAGGTREPVDSVRFLGNRSSGRQGYAIAAELQRRGADVTLVTTAELTAPPGAVVEAVETAEQMRTAVLDAARSADLVVMAAAVADFRPKVQVAGKIKKADGVPDLILEATPDILAELGATKRQGQILVGFAAEAIGGDRTDMDPVVEHPVIEHQVIERQVIEHPVTEPPHNERKTSGTSIDDPAGSAGRVTTGEGRNAKSDLLVSLARGKLSSKGADLLVANDVDAAGVGFGHLTNAVVIVTEDGAVLDVALADKTVIAGAVVDAIVAYRRRRHRSSSPAA